MPKITGASAHTARLKRLTSPEARRQIGVALYAAGEIIEVAAALSITDGAVSGDGHIPSAPGQPPNADTHVLDRNIETIRESDERVLVSSNAPYSKALEFGTSKVRERPFMRPAAAAHKKEAADLIRRAVAHIAAGGTVR